jgi:hypothetical protein
MSMCCWLGPNLHKAFKYLSNLALSFLCLSAAKPKSICCYVFNILPCGLGLVSLIGRTIWSNPGMATCAAIPCGKFHYCIDKYGGQ